MHTAKNDPQVYIPSSRKTIPMPVKATDHSAIVRAVLEQVKPKHPNLAPITAMLTAIAKEVKRQKIKAEVVLGGSFAKDVYLEGDSDVDIFVRFDATKYNNDEISTLLGSILAPWKPDLMHGSRDYYQIKREYVYELIPVLAIDKTEDAKNVIDCSPLHTRWVTTRGKGLNDDIRVAKRFAKAARAYGAESYQSGFSGHVMDILVIHYGGFLPFVKAAAGWKTKVVLDVPKAYKRSPLIYLNNAKTAGPLVVIDPIDPTRNAAAAVLDESFDRLVVHAKQFMKKPSLELFVDPRRPTKPTANEIFITATPIDDKEDIAGAKLRRAMETIAKHIKKQLTVTSSEWWWDTKGDALFVYRCTSLNLPTHLMLQGPPVEMKDHVKLFKKEHPSAVVKDKRLVAKEKNPFSSLEQFLAPCFADCIARKLVKAIKKQ